MGAACSLLTSSSWLAGNHTVAASACVHLTTLCVGLSMQLQLSLHASPLLISPK